MKKMMLEATQAWHKYQYRKYAYLEEGCLNEEVRQELNQKKRNHYRKYTAICLPESRAMGVYKRILH